MKTALYAAVLLTQAAAAQGALDFPLSPSGLDADFGLERLVPSAEATAMLLAREQVILTDVPLAGRTVSLELQRVRHELFGFQFFVDGRAAPGLLDGLDLSIWRGAVVGEPTSEAFLSFSRAGSRGWIRSGGTLVHFLPQPDATGSYEDGYVLAATDAELSALGMFADLRCDADLLVNLRASELDAIPSGRPGSGVAKGSSGTLLYGCEIALESDYQLNQVFGGNLAAETAYVTTLWSAVSNRYIEQIGTVLTFPYVQFYTTPADPWTSPDIGGSSGDMLDEFLNAWSGNIPGGAQVGHFLSGADLGGGIAYLSVLCDTAESFSFAVSGNLDGDTPFPIAVGPLNWDFMVTAHETGHNFGSPHTHDFSPPIDECAFGICITDGTIMSYCHLCAGGLLNITTYFHPLCVDVMKAHVAGCLSPIAGISALPPSILTPGATTNLTASVAGTPVGPVLFNYRLDAASAFLSVPMSPVGGGDYAATLPAAACGDDPEFYFSYVDALAGALSTGVFSAEVADVVTLFEDNFQTDKGWVVGAAGDTATTGIWLRADPIGTSAQPSTGLDLGTGPNCFFTGQGTTGGSLGENDVDGGKTTLVSPAFNLSTGDARIGYWRWYSNTTGSTPNQDVFTVEVSNNGTTWVNVESVGPGGPEVSGGWVYHEFLVSDFVAPTANVKVRFIAADQEPGSIVEAALDEVRVFRVSCDVCQPDLGFGGPGSVTLNVCGPVLEPGAMATLTLANGPAGAPAWVGYSTQFNPTSVFGGTLVPIPLAGFVAFVLSGSGSATAPVVGGASVPVTLYAQGIVLSGTGQFLISNAVAVEYFP
jgi:hypothetical protein